MYCTDGSRINFYILISNYFCCCCLLGDSFLLETKESIVFEKKKLKRTNHMSVPAHPAKRTRLLSFLVINSKMERITQKVEE